MRFSVVIAVYQGSAHVGRAVSSALDQTQPPHEVIVVDDGSTDDLEQALAPYRDRIMLLRQENHGAASARNRGMDAATGDWAVVLDHDDYWAPNRLELIARRIEADPLVGLVTTDAIVVDDSEMPIRRYYDRVDFPEERQLDELLKTNFVFGSAAFPLDAARRLGGFSEDLRHVEDYDLWLRLVLDGATVALVDEAVAYYRIHAANKSHNQANMSAHKRRVLAGLLDEYDLTSSQRRVIVERLTSKPAPTVVASEIRRALAAGAPVRRLALRLAFHREATVRLRLKALVAAVWPQMARKVVLGR